MSAPVRLLYFAWLRARIGVTAEEVALPAEVGDVAGGRWSPFDDKGDGGRVGGK